MSSTKKKYDFRFYDEKPDVIVLSGRKLVITEAPEVFAPRKETAFSQSTKHMNPKHTSDTKND